MLALKVLGWSVGCGLLLRMDRSPSTWTGMMTGRGSPSALTRSLLGGPGVYAAAVPSMDEIEAPMCIPRATDADPQRRAEAS